jgi:hypothetical protein
MRILRSIVAPSTALIAFCNSKVTGCSPIRSQVIRDELVWDKPYFFSSFRISLSAARLFLLGGMGPYPSQLIDGAIRAIYIAGAWFGSVAGGH